MIGAFLCLDDIDKPMSQEINGFRVIAGRLLQQFIESTASSGYPELALCLASQAATFCFSQAAQPRASHWPL